MRWEPYTFSVDGEMVGMAALARELEQPELVWLYHFFIDERFQGRGYGREALATLISQVKSLQPLCQSLLLTVHPENSRRSGSIPLWDSRQPEMSGGEPVYRLALRESGE